MNQQQRDAIFNRFQGMVEKAVALADDLMAQSDEVSRRFSEERAAFETFRAAEANLDEAVNAAILEADYIANSVKEGPLAGLARTSEVYKLAIKNLRANLMTGELYEEAVSLRTHEAAHRNAVAAYENAKTRLSGMRASSELLSSVLRAVSV